MKMFKLDIRSHSAMLVSQDAPLQYDDQEGIQHPTHCYESPGTDTYISLPIHPPVIINLNDEDDEEDDEENYISEWVPKTAADIEEERAIKEICYKSGEYYRVQYPQENQSTSTVPSFWENGLLPFEAPKQVVQKEFTSETNHTELLKKYHCKDLKENKWVSEEPRNSPNTVGSKGIHTSYCKVKPCHQQRSQRKGTEIAASVPNVRETRRKTHLNSPNPRRSAYVVYRSVTHEPNSNGSTKQPQLFSLPFCSAVPEPYGGKCSKVENQLTINRRLCTHMQNYDKYNSGFYSAPAWKNRNPHAKTFPKNRRTIHTQEDLEMNRKGEQYTERRDDGNASIYKNN
ncbi:uncharacterized protein C12orf50 homolog [Colius striatus]|uniref:uncharacterized protein C12orf50 homolog n=1 Tax=Colius striatus TaxID=57412 RepID=UPI002B1D2E0A|nr:uncharacterized protein C12orf50 homolog [Colius striatus]